MAITIHYDAVAAGTAGSLTSALKDRSQSVERLASGRRLTSSADSAAALAASSRMRSDLAVLAQGTRNTMDALDMLRTHDTALDRIRTLLTDMRQLAMQASEGWRSDIQRRIIDEAFQANAREIETIARATDYNGIRLLWDGAPQPLPSPQQPQPQPPQPQPGRPPQVEIPTYAVLSFMHGLDGAPVVKNVEVLNPDAFTDDVDIEFQNSMIADIISYTGDPIIQYWGAQPDVSFLGETFTFRYEYATNTWSWDEHPEATTSGLVVGPPSNEGVSFVLDDGRKFALLPSTEYFAPYTNISGSISSESGIIPRYELNGDVVVTIRARENDPLVGYSILPYDRNGNYPNVSIVHHETDIRDDTVTLTFEINLDGDPQGTGDIRVSFEQKLTEETAPDEFLEPLHMLRFSVKATVDPTPPGPGPGPGPGPTPGPVVPEEERGVLIHFGPNSTMHDQLAITARKISRETLGLTNLDISAADAAPWVAASVEAAIDAVDGIRRHFGGFQSRLESTAASLVMKSDNLRLADHRMADVEVAEEMRDFVRSTVLANAASGMLTARNDGMRELSRRLLFPDAGGSDGGEEESPQTARPVQAGLSGNDIRDRLALLGTGTGLSAQFEPVAPRPDQAEYASRAVLAGAGAVPDARTARAAARRKAKEPARDLVAVNHGIGGSILDLDS